MNKPVVIIAEAGVNHNGNITIAKQLIDVAKEAGVDYVKFQLGVPELLLSKFAPKAEYQKQNTDSSESQLDMIKKISLTFDEHLELMEYCKFKQIQYLCTPFDLVSLDFLNSHGMNLWKIPSGEITNFPYLVAIAKTKKPIIMSTGMATMQEIEEALNVLKNNGSSLNSIILLHCTTEYPAPLHEVNLHAMNTLQQKFGVSVGYSDHTIGIEISIAAVALGACVIEKHFTLDKTMSGPDHKASINPQELQALVTQIRNVELALGSNKKEPGEAETKNKIVARKSIVANCSIKKGEEFSELNITTKRPGNGISPMRWQDVLGKKAIKDFETDELIEL
jgi:N,N'-diacetyllegionaminate synthase